MDVDVLKTGGKLDVIDDKIIDPKNTTDRQENANVDVNVEIIENHSEISSYERGSLKARRR